MKRHHSKHSGCQSKAQKKRKYRHIKKETKLNAARRVEAVVGMHSSDNIEPMSSSLNESHGLEGIVNVPEIDATNWIGSLSTIPLAFIPSAFSGMYKRCIWAMGQSLETAKDLVFPSRKFRRELESTQLKLIQLEQSLEKILQEKDTKTDGQCTCCCSRSLCDSLTDSSNTSYNSSHHPAPALPKALQVVPPPPCLGLPPPPLPPPPPPPPPPVKEVKQFKLVINKVKKMENTRNVEKRFQISSNDLRKVKLRRINHNNQDKKIPESGAGGQTGNPLVSLKDLQKVKLRRLSLGSNLSPQSQQVLRKRLPQEAVEFRSSLKKVCIARSPGGTPFRRHMQDSGTGLTPLMTRALKRKFKKARTPSPIPMNQFPSPSSPKPVKPLRM